MTESERWEVWAHVDKEGFDYCFRHYSSFKEIKDPKFHKLIKIYEMAAGALEEYVKPEDA